MRVEEVPRRTDAIAALVGANLKLYKSEKSRRRAWLLAYVLLAIVVVETGILLALQVSLAS